MSLPSSYQTLNEELFAQLGDKGMEKNAQDAANDFVRTEVRERGILRRVMPPIQLTNEDLTREVDTDQPSKVVDKQPGSPGAVTLAFGDLPTGVYIRGPRFRVTFARISTRRFFKDVNELRTYEMDIRQVISDNSIKDILAEEDSKFLSAVNASLGGVADGASPMTGVVQWETIWGGVERNTVEEALTIMKKAPNPPEPATVLVNHVTIHRILSWDYVAAGGSLSGDFLENGWAERRLHNRDWIVTNKRNLVPDDTMFFFADPRFIGKFYVLEDTTMHLKREAYIISFFNYETVGAGIGNAGGLARADFA